MAQLIVRKIEKEIVRLLKIRAARHGRSAEAEHREILRQVLKPGGKGRTLKQHLVAMPDVGEDSDFERDRDLPRRIDL